MDATTRALVTAERDKYGNIALELYHAYILLNLAVMEKEGYTFTYQVRARHLWEAESGISSKAEGATLEAAIAVCVAAHQAANHTKTDFQVAWYATLTVTKGNWSRRIPVDPKHYQHLVPGGQFDSGFTLANGTPTLALAS